MEKEYKSDTGNKEEIHWRKLSEYGLSEDGKIDGLNRAAQTTLGFLEETNQNTFNLGDVADRLGRPKDGKPIDEKIPYESFIGRNELASGMTQIRDDLGVERTEDWKWGGENSNYMVSEVRNSISENSDYKFNWDNQ
jgi:hypothetical protein